MMNWLDFKDEAARLLFEKDALHIYAAVAIQITAAHLSRQSLGDWLPWAVVLMFETLNEALDITLGQESTLRLWQVAGALHDAINTMLMPTILLILVRHGQAMLTWAPRAPLSDRPEATPGT